MAIAISAPCDEKKKAPEGALKFCGPCIGGCGEAGRFEGVTGAVGSGRVGRAWKRSGACTTEELRGNRGR